MHQPCHRKHSREEDTEVHRFSGQQQCAVPRFAEAIIIIISIIIMTSVPTVRHLKAGFTLRSSVTDPNHKSSELGRITGLPGRPGSTKTVGWLSMMAINFYIDCS